ILKEIEKKDITDFYFIQEEEPEKNLNQILTLCSERIPKHFGFHSIRDIQVLTPMHKGLAGTANLNLELQKELNPGAEELVRGSRTFRIRDKVMQIRNNYDKEVYNGDIGRVKNIDTENQLLTVTYEDRDVPYDFSELDELVLAYAVSVHKSQGSEYPAVILALLPQHYILLQRNLIYTGVTRGRKLVVLIGTAKALSMGIHNNKPQLRYTYLRERLAQAAGVDGSKPTARS
ncbi:MAG: ATP-dependent RecD-like DNA helicase, partial [Desulfobacteraceae bacterium]